MAHGSFSIGGAHQVVELLGRPEAARRWPRPGRATRARLLPAGRPTARSVPAQPPSVGMTLAASPAWIAPKVRFTASRLSVSLVRPAGRSVASLAITCDEVDGAVGPGGVAAGTLEADLDEVGRRGDRARAQPDRAHLEVRVAVQGEDRAATRRSAPLRPSRPAAGIASSAGWNSSRTRPAAPAPSSGSARPGPEHAWCGRRGRRRGTRPAPRTGRARPSSSAAQRVDVGPEHDDRPAVAEVADPARADPGRLGVEAHLQPLPRCGGGAVLLQLGSGWGAGRRRKAQPSARRRRSRSSPGSPAHAGAPASVAQLADQEVDDVDEVAPVRRPRRRWRA